MLWVKICGITKPEQGRAIAQMGVAALGFMCVPESPRYVSPTQMGAIVAALPTAVDTTQPAVERIGVFVNASMEAIGAAIWVGNLSGVQLHGDEPPEFCDSLRVAQPDVAIIKALRIRMPADLDLATQYENCVDALLLDAYHPNLFGGTGQTLDWQMLQRFQPACRWFLAGGLTPANILDALGQVTPNGIDLSSGVENTPGDKNLAAVARLLEQLQVKGYVTLPNLP